MPQSPRKRVAVRAIDTNIIVRFLTGDDPEQAGRARRLIEGGEIFVATSVVLESEWVLRSGYGFSAESIVHALRGLAGLPGVAFEDGTLVARALDWVEAGMDFADALHLGRADGCSAFMSFDRKLGRLATRLSDVEVAEP